MSEGKAMVDLPREKTEPEHAESAILAVRETESAAVGHDRLS